MNIVERFLTSSAGADRVGGWRPSGSIVLTPRFTDSRHVVVLLLDRAGQPRLVGKVVRAPHDPSTLDREVGVLGAVRDGMHPEHRHSLPQPLALEWFEDHRVMVQSAVAGRVITHGHVRSHPQLWWDRVEAWLRTLPRSSSGEADASWFDEYLAAGVDLARENLGAAGVLTAQLDQQLHTTLEQARALADAADHLVGEHGDLSAPNLVWSRRGLAVVDWETGNLVGLPGVDAATFLTFSEFSRARAHGVTAECDVFTRQLVAPDGRGRDLLGRYLHVLDLDPELTDSVLVTAWGKIALSAFGRLLTTSDRQSEAASRRAVARFLTGSPFALWTAALAGAGSR